jgi:hypothetical protein
MIGSGLLPCGGRINKCEQVSGARQFLFIFSDKYM